MKPNAGGIRDWLRECCGVSGEELTRATAYLSGWWREPDASPDGPDEARWRMLARPSLVGGAGRWSGDRVLLDALQRVGFTKGEAFRAAARDPDGLEHKPGWDAVLRDPYRATDLDGIGFTKADDWARQVLGVPPDHPGRIRACAVFVLEQGAYNGVKDDHAGMGGGHTWLPRGVWGREVMRLTGAPADACLDAIGSAVWRGAVAGTPAVARVHRVRAEAQSAAALACGDPVVADPGERIVITTERGTAELGDDQRRAVRTSLGAGVSVITGRAGTGKTTAIEAVMRGLNEAGHAVELCAPTGKAARRASEATGRAASTIHRMLRFNGVGFQRDLEDDPLDAVVVDEASMVDAQLMATLLRFGPSRLVLCGDPYQLPPVGPGAPLRDVLDAGVAPAVELLEVRRSAGVIPRLASELVEGRFVAQTTRDRSSAWVVDQAEDQDLVEAARAAYATWQRDDPSGVDAGDYTVLAYRNVDVDAVNRVVQADRTGAADAWTFNPGDRVIWTNANNYGVEPNVLNGQVGVVVDGGTMRDVTVQWDGEAAECGVSGLRGRLCLAYALTCHRAQGSEYEEVVVLAANRDAWLMDRTWLYTAVTRAKRTTRLVGSVKAMRGGARRKRAQARRTFLAAFHRGEVAGWDEDDGKELWETNAACAAENGGS